MSQLININNIQDPNFRYKINKISITYSGSGTQKGFLTKLDNIELVASQINHNPQTLLKYIGICLGSKVNEQDFWIQGNHSITKIQNCIFEFIKCFVICHKCSIPEIQYTTKKLKTHSLIKTHCIGCGFDYIIDPNVLNKYNKKIFDKIINDIDTSYFNKKNITSNIHESQQFIIEEDQDFF